MRYTRFAGLIAAILTPLDPITGQLQLMQIRPLVEHLLGSGVAGFYCCGSTGEGVSLTDSDRKRLVEQLVKDVNGRAPVVVQVGHNSLRAAAELARHAQDFGASSISATCPSYFKVDSIPGLQECMAEIAAGAPELPFYYYHIPALTGNRLNMADFLASAGDAIPNLVGMKFTAPELHEFQQCLALQSGRFEVIWGTDEMLLAAWAVGAQAAIGSTYNVAAPLYRQLISAFQAGDLVTARECQLRSIHLIAVLKQFPFFAGLKQIITARGIEMGGCLPPNASLTSAQKDQLASALAKIGFEV